jgi:hypothetical protein
MNVVWFFMNVHPRGVDRGSQRDGLCPHGHGRSQQGQKEKSGEEETQLHLDCTFVM